MEVESRPDSYLSVLSVLLDPTALHYSLSLADRWNDRCKIVAAVTGHYSLSVT